MAAPREDSFMAEGPAGPHRIVYDVWGPDDATQTILCVHGLTRNAHDFDVLAETLSQTARVVCVDVAGRGRSEWLKNPADYKYVTYCADIAQLLLRLELTQVDWIGTSMGGHIGMFMAAQPATPVRRMVMNDVGPYVPLASMQRISAYTGKDPHFDHLGEVEAYLRKLYADAGPFTDSDFKNMAKHGVRTLENGRLGLAYDPAIGGGIALVKEDIDLWPFYDAIKCPTLLLHGAISDVLPTKVADEMTQRGPKAQLMRIPGIGHIPGLTDPHQIGAVHAFLT